MTPTAPPTTDRSRMVRIFRKIRRVNRLPYWLRYGVTVGLVLLASTVPMVHPGVHIGALFLLYFPVILVTGFIFDRGAGVLAAVLSVLAMLYFLPPVGSFQVSRDLIQPLMFFVVVAFSLALVLEALQIAVGAAIRQQDRLSVLVAQLERSRARAVESEERKEMLLKELSHRVHNDLAGVIGLLRLQARTHPQAAPMLDDAAHRVFVLSQVHSRLAQREGEVVVNVGDFLRELCADLKVSRLGNRPVEIRVQARDSFLPFATVSAIGLITNELITNAAKYAFPDRPGVIEVAFDTDGRDCEIRVEDDGVGFDEARPAGLGTKIVDSLTQQIGGTLTRTPRQPGTRTVLRFPARPPAEGQIAG